MKETLKQLARAASNWPRQLSFAVIWCAIVSGGVGINLHAQHWPLDSNFINLLWPFVTASLLAGYLSLLFAQGFVKNKPTMSRFAFFFAALCILTVGLTALIFAVQYRLSFPQWSAPIFSFEWLKRTFFTTMSAAYLFSVVGFRLLMPWGLIALFIASVGFSRGWLKPSR